jgi:hypothetical protein
MSACSKTRRSADINLRAATRPNCLRRHTHRPLPVPDYAVHEA